MSDSSNNANRMIRGLAMAIGVLAALVALVYAALDQSGDSGNPKPTPSASTTK